MDIDEAEKIAKDFLKKKKNAGFIKIKAVKQIDSITWQVLGSYGLEGSERLEANFELQINENVKKVVSYNFEEMGGAIL